LIGADESASKGRENQTDVLAPFITNGETAQYLGIEYVTEPVPVKDEKTGEVTHHEEQPVERGVWRTEVVRQVEKEQPAKAEAKANKPETAKPDEKQDQKQERDRAEDQRQEQQRRESHKPRHLP
jgi:hypothetical protein